jgi:hypothetical protein
MAGITRAERERRDALYALGLKQCTTCDEPLPLADFAPQSDGYRGLTGSCRPCRNVRTADYQKRNPDKVADKVLRWRHENPEARRAIVRRYEARARWRRNGVAA